MIRQRRLSRNAIRARLMEQGLNLASLARREGLSSSACRVALHGPSSPAGEQAIAKALGIPAMQIWPERYEASGERKSTSEIRGAA